MNNRVSVLAFDQDVVNIAGAGRSNFVSTSSRFNGNTDSSTPANNDKFKYNRFFTKGGLYKVRFIYVKASDGGKIDIGLDSSTNNLFSQVDEYINNSGTWNQIIETTFEIPRGYHDIVFTGNGKNASSSNYDLYFEGIFFDLIMEYQVYKDDKPAQINQGSMVLLGRHIAAIAESSFTFNFADIVALDKSTPGKYSKLVIEIDGNNTASLALQMVVNGIVSGLYYQQGYTSIGASLANVTKSAASLFEILGTNILTGASDRMRARIEIAIVQSTFEISFEWSAVGGAQGVTGGSGWLNSAEPITSIKIQTSTSTWSAGTSIVIWGVKAY